MALTHQFRRLAFAQVVLGIVAFCLAEPNPGLLLIAGALAGLSWYVSEGPSGKPIPHWLVNLGVVPALAWMVYDIATHGGAVIVPVGHFTMTLQVLMLYARKTNREYAELLVLSMLQMVGASVLSVSMVYGVLLMGYCVLALVTLLVFQFKSTSDRIRRHNTQAAGSGVAVIMPRDVTGRGYRWHLRGSAIVIGLVCLAAGVVVFVVTPRQPLSHMKSATSRSVGSTSQTGFNDRVDLNGPAPQRGNRQPVLNLTVTRDGHPIDNPQDRTFLLRGAALDLYSPRRHTWNRDPRHLHNDKRLTLGGKGIQLAALPPGTPVMEGEVTLRQPGLQNLFTVEPITYIASRQRIKLSFNPRDQRIATASQNQGVRLYTMRWPAPGAPAAALENLQQRYEQAVGSVSLWREPPPRRGRDGSAGDNQGLPPPSIDPVAQATRWTVQRERVADTARALLSERGIAPPPAGSQGTPDHPLKLAGALAQGLRDHYTYTLSNPPTRGDKDPVIAFLFDRQQGHCELFAAGLTALCRSLNIPARVVTGFRAGSYNEMGGYYVVRQSDAHAWTEVYGSKKTGWRTFDATPPAAVAAEHADDGWFASARHIYDYLEFAWIGSVVAYDHRTRSALLGKVKTAFATLADPHKSFVGQIIAWGRQLPSDWQLDRVGYTMAGFVLVMIGVGLLTLTRILLARRRRLIALQLHTLPRRGRRRLGRKLRFYLAMLEMLERHGYRRPPWQSPFGFAQELAEANPMKFDPVLALTELFYEVRFGYRELTEDRRQRIRAHLKHLETALAPGRA